MVKTTELSLVILRGKNKYLRKRWSSVEREFNINFQSKFQLIFVLAQSSNKNKYCKMQSNSHFKHNTTILIFLK